jgi:hypothetical protein
MRLSQRLERQPELPAASGTVRFLFWVLVAVAVASVLVIGDAVVDLPSRMDGD